LENPPLWVWAIIVAAIVASKFIYRWQSTKYFAKEAEEKSRRNCPDDKTKVVRKNGFYDYSNKRYTTNIGAHKYSPRRFYKDYFAIKNKKKE
jgi:hypothetical protein